MTYIPYGIRLIEKYFPVSSPTVKLKRYKLLIAFLTYWVYTCYHLSRKPISVVKNVLNQNCSQLIPPNNHTNNSHWCDWKPFDGDDSSALLGTLDSAYLFTYAFGMFVSGWVAERSNLSTFLATGMIMSGILTAAFGLGRPLQIHIFSFYLIIQLFGGIFQSSGWPGVVTAMGNWFGKKRRGFIMGIWNSHTSLGNILGTVIANAFIMTGWHMSFIVPGVIIALTGIVVLLILIPEPTMVGLPDQNDKSQILQTTQDDLDESQSLLDPEIVSTSSTVSITDEKSAISFWKALAIPGVVEFSVSLFFSKLVSYTFLYWLPHFLLETTKNNASESANISTLFDVGGIFGGILAGVVSDTTNKPAVTCSVMLIISTPLLYLYQLLVSSLSNTADLILLAILGLFVNGPYALITTAVSAELGTHHSLQGNAKALSTVTSIIDGTGSMGAAVGPLLAGIISNSWHWAEVFYLLMLANVISLLLLSRISMREMKQLFRRYRV